MSLLRALWHALLMRYYRLALEHMRADHPDLHYVSLRYALHRDQVRRFVEHGQ